MLVTRLYRLLLKNTKPLLRKRNKEFLNGTIEVLQKDIEKFSKSEKILSKSSKNYQLTLREAFQEGNKNDVNNLLAILPKVFKYARAMRIIDEHQVTLLGKHRKGNNSVTTYAKNSYNISQGALLVSKLYYDEKQLKERNVDKIFADFLQEMKMEVRKELEVLTKEKDFFSALSSLATQLNYSSAVELVGNDQKCLDDLYDRKKYKILLLISALNNVIYRREQQRDIGQDHEHLIDQVIQPVSSYYRAMPITYASLYTALINSLNFDVTAFGVLFPSHFLSRLILTNSINDKQSDGKYDINTNNPLLLKKSIDANNLLTKILEKNNKSEKHTLHKYYDKVMVRASQLTGHWLCTTDTGFHEVLITYNRATSSLQCFMLDFNENAQRDQQQTGTSSRLLWQLNLKSLEDNKDLGQSDYLKTEHEYRAEIFHEINAENSPQSNLVKDCTVSLAAMSKRTAESISTQKFVEQIVGKSVLGAQELENDVEQRRILELQVIYQERAADMDAEEIASLEKQFENLIDIVSKGTDESSHSAAKSTETVTESANNVTVVSEQPNTAENNASNASAGGHSKIVNDLASTAVNETREVVHYYIKVQDLDLCLVDFNLEGATPITPRNYIESIHRQGYGQDSLSKLLEAASALAVSSRMSANIMRSTIKQHTNQSNSFINNLINHINNNTSYKQNSSEAVFENTSYWAVIRRHFESMQRAQEDK